VTKRGKYNIREHDEMGYDGLSMADVAKVIGCSRGYVNNLEKRALERMRQMIAEAMREEQS
jgi:DNA-directed RNA polymerase specialized sigma24 family protein